MLVYRDQRLYCPNRYLGSLRFSDRSDRGLMSSVETERNVTVKCEAVSNMSKSTNLLTYTQVKGRGWTDTMIEKFLGQPVEMRPNPHYLSWVADAAVFLETGQAN